MILGVSGIIQSLHIPSLQRTRPAESGRGLSILRHHKNIVLIQTLHGGSGRKVVCHGTCRYSNAEQSNGRRPRGPDSSLSQPSLGRSRACPWHIDNLADVRDLGLNVALPWTVPRAYCAGIWCDYANVAVRHPS